MHIETSKMRYWVWDSDVVIPHMSACWNTAVDVHKQDIDRVAVTDAAIIVYFSRTFQAICETPVYTTPPRCRTTVRYIDHFELTRPPDDVVADLVRELRERGITVIEDN